MTASKELLLAAVREAAFELPLDALTPSEVARRAGAHRVTFYRHWPDIATAVIEAFTDEIDRLSAVDDAVVDTADDVSALAALYERTLVGALTEIQAQREVYRTLFGWPTFQERVRATLTERADTMVRALGRSGITVAGASDGTAAAFVGGASLGVLASWAADDAVDIAERAQTIIAQMPAWWPRTRTS
jgi:AcrR family transcriptional regulator